MSRKERDWLKVLTRVLKRELRLKEAAFLMAVSYGAVLATAESFQSRR